MPFYLYIASLFLIFFATVILFVTGHERAASLVGQVGTAVIVVAMFISVVITDPMQRYPNTSLWRRFVKIITLRW